VNHSSESAGGPVVVVDFGAQYNQLIARRVREAGVFCEVVPAAAGARNILTRRPRAVILSGGPASVYEPGAPTLDPVLFAAGIPVLGICYGFQLMARLLGGVVEPAARREYGRAVLTTTAPSPLTEGIPEQSVVWMSHGDIVRRAPPGFQVLGTTPDSPVAVMGDPDRKLYGVQFHPEVRHSEYGQRVLENFLGRVAGLPRDWSTPDMIAEAVATIRRTVGDAHALVALSGGVDSAVAARLAHSALGDRLHAVLVDHGLLRAGEVEEVVRAFPDLDLTVVDARDRFLAALDGVADPEAKRKIIGRTFIEVFQEAAARYRDVAFLVQGTVYPDVIESGGSGAATIKSHHNVGGLPDAVPFRLVEPLRWLFKDEVRRVGAALGLPDAIVWRHPFPGPGLAIRILGAVTEDRLRMVRESDRIVREELRQANWDRRVWQVFTVLAADVRSVGVMGDQRTYGHPIIIRAVESDDGMTADWVRLPSELLDRMAQRIIGEVAGVNRVVYDITSKPPATIEWE
jgi:GMP synthase (glutamine-hydrolysing)